MKSLGTALRHAIEQSGYSIYRTAGKSGINRTTLQKILSDDRPVSIDQLNRILSVLKLSSDEEAEILTIHEISQSGEGLYTIRQSIRRLFSVLSDPDVSFPEYSLHYENTPPQSKFCTFKPQILSGALQVGTALRELLLQECLRDEPLLRLSLPGNSPILSRVLSGILPPEIRVQHITRFLRTSDMEQGTLRNLDILSNLLPLSMLSSFDYQICYFYDNLFSTEPLDMAFPYYALFSDALILLSSDGSIALPCTDSSTIRYFSYLFESSLRKTRRLIGNCSTAEHILDYFLHPKDRDTVFSSIEFQPCLITFLSDEHFFQYANKDIPDRDLLIQNIIKRRQQLISTKNRRCIFSKSGLMMFVSAGIISDLPAGCMEPLSVQHRIQILETLCQTLESSSWDFRISNPVTFPLTPAFSCAIHSDIEVEFFHFGQKTPEFKHVSIQENTILDAFEDFFQYTLESPLVSSREDTLAELSSCIRRLKNNYY